MSARSITSSHHSSTLGKVSPGSIAPTRHSSRRSHSSESNHSARSDTTETPTQLSLSRSLIATRSSRGRGDAISTESSNASPPLSQSPSFRLTRKRAAEEFERTVESKPVEVDEMDMEEISPTHTRASSGDSGGGQAGLHVCLCQPDPKIPRPRNAFILYRQHHQGAVASQYPGLPNPEISKIIGERWRRETPAVKNQWKLLAEEEKVRHQQQYPTYRYQPRRAATRRGSTDFGTASTNASDKYRCNKCGGRSIISAGSPFAGNQRALVPAGPPSSSTNSSLPSAGLSTPGSAHFRIPAGLNTPLTPSLNTPTTRLPPMLSNLSLNSPSYSHGNRPTLPPPSPAGSEMNTPPRRVRTLAHDLPAIHVPHHAMGPPPAPSARFAARYSTYDGAFDDPSEPPPGPLSPDPKRRRYNTQYDVRRDRQSVYVRGDVGIRTPYPFPQSSRTTAGPGPMHLHTTSSPGLGLNGRRESLPPPLTIVNRGSVAGPAHSMVRTAPLTGLDAESLTLPPLQTSAFTSSNATHGKVPPSNDRPPPDQVRNNMHFLNRIKMLHYITPSAPFPDHASIKPASSVFSPPLQPEGVALENNSLRSTATKPFRGALVAIEGDDIEAVAALTRWLETFLSSDGDFEVRAAEGTVMAARRGSTTADGQKSGASLAEYITLVQNWHSKVNEMVTWVNRTVPDITDEGSGDAPGQRGQQRHDSGQGVVEIGNETTERDTAQQPPHETKPPIPVLLLPTYQLAASDHFATRVPIRDSYAAPDHWQWMASLWRGVPSADITVYIKDLPRGAASSPPGSSSGVGGAAGGLTPGIGVEVKEEMRTVVLKREAGKDVEEKWLRRVGFEVGEWMRGMRVASEEEKRGMKGLDQGKTGVGGCGGDSEHGSELVSNQEGWLREVRGRMEEVGTQRG